MKKMIFMLLLAVAVFVTGCGNEDGKTTQEPQKTDEEKDNGTTEAENANQETTELEQDVDTEQDTETEQNIPDDSSEKVDAYMTSLKEQSDSIKASLENDVLTQHDMNMKSEELLKLWDDALNYLWGELKNRLPEDEFAKLLDEQRVWIADKEKAVEEAGKEVEGGSMYPLVVNSESATLTEKRVYELYDLLK